MYVDTGLIEWRFLQFFCLNWLMILMGKDNVGRMQGVLCDFQ